MVKDVDVLTTKSFRIQRASDKKTWVYQEAGKNKEGILDHWNTVGYYGKISDLVRYLVNREIGVPTSDSKEQLKEILAEIKRLEKSLATQIEEGLKEKGIS